MTQHNWNATAKGLAEYVQQFRLFIQRGAVPVHIDYEQPAFGEDDSPLVVGVFGNDQALGALANDEVEIIRQGLTELTSEESLQELGFAVSEEGSTWAMLVGERMHLLTNAGKTFRMELLKSFLEDLVWNAWQQVTERLTPEQTDEPWR